MATNYYRVTAYLPSEDISAIFDSFGLYEKLWQLSSELIRKGFKIIEVSGEDKFLDGNIDKAEHTPDCLILRSHAKGTPETTTLTQNGTTYIAIKVGNKTYIPDKSKARNIPINH